MNWFLYDRDLRNESVKHKDYFLWIIDQPGFINILGGILHH